MLLLRRLCLPDLMPGAAGWNGSPGLGHRSYLCPVLPLQRDQVKAVHVRRHRHLLVHSKGVHAAKHKQPIPAAEG